MVSSYFIKIIDGMNVNINSRIPYNTLHCAVVKCKYIVSVKNIFNSNLRILLNSIVISQIKCD